jgi:hypothetical protein
MSRLDVMKSLLRSAAGEASEQLERLSHTGPVRRLLGEFLKGRHFVTDAQLTAALARVSGLVAATVSTHEGGLSIDATFSDGGSLLVRLCPAGVTFAQHGAKELRMRVEPEAAALDARAADAFVAIATEVARALWGPLLVRQEERGKMTSVHRADDVLILDLRSLGEVRAALRQRLRATAMETFALHSLAAQEGGLRLLPKIAGL